MNLYVSATLALNLKGQLGDLKKRREANYPQNISLEKKGGFRLQRKQQKNTQPLK